jgi:hypothetical protein
MWIFALEGFVSVVAVRGKEDELLVRGRVREDVEHWHRLAGRRGRPVKPTPRADYGWRFVTTRERFARALGAMVADLRYENFKSAAHGEPDRDRAYMDVWGAMMELGEGRR